jgi:hypothetical protein
VHRARPGPRRERIISPESPERREAGTPLGALR